MKIKLLSLLAVVLVSISVCAVPPTNLTGSYGGTLSVYEGSTPTQSLDTVLLVLQGDGTYTLSILDFSYGATVIGDIVVDEIVSTESNGVSNLTRSGSLPGPVVYGFISTTITLEPSSVTNGVLSLAINVSVPLVGNIPVTFVGSKIVTSLSETKIQSIAIVPSLATIYISVQGEAGSNYVIYSIAGSPVLSGKLSGEDINVSALPSGVYLFTLEGKSGRFVKK